MLIPAFATRLLPQIARVARLRRQSIAPKFAPAAALCAALLATACSSDANLGQPGFIEGFAGATVADEPNAALIGRDLLAAGGSAGDAAAGVFFALTATKPASAGLMASGVCLAYNPTLDLHQAYRFQAPGAVRGFAAIHARFGLLPWRQVLGPAEAMARFGARVSAAFVDDWNRAPPNSSAAREIYGNRPVIGDQVQNVALASLLGQIRVNGAGAFYNGTAAKQVWEAMADAGIAVDKAQWRGTVPVAAESVRVQYGNHDAVFAPFPGTTGPGQAAIWPNLEDRGTAALPQLLANAGASANAPTAAETSFVTVDRFGGAIACSITMGQPYGTGQMVSGMFVARPATPSGGPILISNKPTNVFLAALAAAGVPGWESAIALEAMEKNMTLAAATALPRTAPTGRGGYLAEAGAVNPGGGVQSVQQLGRVNGVVCLRGLPNYPDSCSAAADPRGKGYAAVADTPG